MGVEPLPVAIRLWAESHQLTDVDADGGKRGAGSNDETTSVQVPAGPAAP